MSKKAVRMLQSLGVITFAVVLGICCMQTVNPNNEMSDTTEVHLTAGVADAFVESDGASGILVAGVSGQMHDYLGTLDPMLQEKSTVMVASGSYASDTSDGTKQDQICGYVNIGVSNIEDALNVREAASIDSSVVGKMTSHAACEILGVEGEWTHISSGKVEGYVKSEFLYTGEEAKA
ncbi:MAG: SH3 domain-containing protein, partial [Agathobacter sp.]|nr:SH3 domain-containing protein [Agathobacter sp.]